MVVDEDGVVEPLGGRVVGDGLSCGDGGGPGDAVDGTDEGGVADLHGAILDEDGGAVQGFAFEVGFDGDAEDGSGGGIDRDRAVILRGGAENGDVGTAAGPGSDGGDAASAAVGRVVGFGGKLVLEGADDFEVGSGAGDGILKDGGLALGSLLPAAPGDFALSGVGEDHGESGAELAAGDESTLLLPEGGVAAWDLTFTLVADGDFAAGAVDKVQAGVRWPLSFADDVRAVVVVKSGAGGEEVGQAGQSIDDILMSGVEDALLRGGVGCRGGEQLAGRGIEERGSIGEQLQGGSDGGADEVSAEAVEGGFGEALGQVYAGELADDVGVGLAGGDVCGEGLIELRDGDALRRDGGNRGRCENPKNEPTVHGAQLPPGLRATPGHDLTSGEGALDASGVVERFARGMLQPDDRGGG